MSGYNDVYNRYMQEANSYAKENGLDPSTSHNGVWDTFRHAYSSAEMAREYGSAAAHAAGELNEIRGDFKHDQPSYERNMDEWNNAAGREIGKNSTSNKRFFSIIRLGCYELIVSTIVSALLFSTTGVYAMGKKYSEQGGKLTAAMNNALLSKGLCKTPRECYDLLPGTLETDARVLIHFYGVGERNQSAFLTIVAFALADGIRITGGVPITIKAFRETHEEYRESGLVIKDIKPFASIEVNK